MIIGPWRSCRTKQRTTRQAANLLCTNEPDIQQATLLIGDTCDGPIGSRYSLHHATAAAAAVVAAAAAAAEAVISAAQQVSACSERARPLMSHLFGL
jgi:hypothetical protein